MITTKTIERTAIQSWTPHSYQATNSPSGIVSSETVDKTAQLHLLTPESQKEMRNGTIPDLTKFCHDLMDLEVKGATNITPVEFSDVFDSVKKFNQVDMSRFLNNPETNHVLLRNSFLKVVLIHWPAGRWSGVHGHPNGGGMFKVIKGSLKELRYNSADPRELLTTCIYKNGSKAFIDDRLAFHNVGNPFKGSAVTLHAYLLN